MAVNPIARDGRKTKRPNRAADHRENLLNGELVAKSVLQTLQVMVHGHSLGLEEYNGHFFGHLDWRVIFAFCEVKKLSGSLVDDGLISKDEFQLGLLKSRKSQSLFADRIFKMFDCNKDGMIEFQEFVKELVCALLKESDLALPGEIVDAIIDRTFEDADQKRDGKIDIEEWKQFVVRYPLVLRNMTIPYLKDMTTAFPNFTVKPEMEDDSD
ncbi:hypothetical protein SAY87_012367 [Trapa incisa]|uniref:Calcineurin B-like protein n=1 Tax=Trapa incisa TaxID=236973 RepID=A0AAN7GP21_9MYRT|nr:hypothetical protein SAY87_012367 [Trapa incisa]